MISLTDAPLVDSKPSVSELERATARRLRNFWHHYRPSEIPEVANTLAALIGKRSSLYGESVAVQQRAVEHLFEILTKKYGPEPGLRCTSRSPSLNSQCSISVLSRSPGVTGESSAFKLRSPSRRSRGVHESYHGSHLVSMMHTPASIDLDRSVPLVSPARRPRNDLVVDRAGIVMNSAHHRETEALGIRMDNFLSSLQSYESSLSELRHKCEEEAVQIYKRELALLQQQELADTSALKREKALQAVSKLLSTREAELSQKEEMLQQLNAELRQREVQVAEREKEARKKAEVAQRIAEELQLHSSVVYAEAERIKQRELALWKANKIHSNKEIRESIVVDTSPSRYSRQETIISRGKQADLLSPRHHFECTDERTAYAQQSNVSFDEKQNTRNGQDANAHSRNNCEKKIKLPFLSGPEREFLELEFEDQNGRFDSGTSLPKHKERYENDNRHQILHSFRQIGKGDEDSTLMQATPKRVGGLLHVADQLKALRRELDGY